MEGHFFIAESPEMEAIQYYRLGRQEAKNANYRESLLHFSSSLNLMTSCMKFTIEKEAVIQFFKVVAQSVLFPMLRRNRELLQEEEYSIILDIFYSLCKVIKEHEPRHLKGECPGYTCQGMRTMLQLIPLYMNFIFEARMFVPKVEETKSIIKSLFYPADKSSIGGHLLLAAVTTSLINDVNMKRKIVLLLDNWGVNFNNKIEKDITPLLIITRELPETAWAVPLLLEKGAHVDSPPQHSQEIVSSIKKFKAANISAVSSLQCLAAQTIAKSEEYQNKNGEAGRLADEIPDHLKIFVQIHNPL